MHGHTPWVSRGCPDFARSPERCWIDGDLIRLSQWPLGGIRPGVRGEPVPWLMDLGVLEEAMQDVYGRGFRLADRAPLLQLAADALAEGDRARAAEIADAVAFPAPEFKSRFRDAGLRYLAWGPAHRRGNPRIDVDAWLARTDLERKYDPDQPRVPRGHPDGGQWTDGAGSDGDGTESLGEGGDEDNPGERPLTDEEYEGLLDVRQAIRSVLADAGDRAALLVLAADRDDNDKRKGSGNGRLEELEKYVEPLRAAVRELISTNQITRLYVLLELVKASARELIGLASDPEEWEKIIADEDFRSFDSPAQFKRFYKSKSDPDRDWHHIVEKDANFPDWMKHNTANMVKIPRAKHWRITKFYSEANDEDPYYGLSPRAWLRGKPWEEHFEHGIDVLKRFKGLK